MTGGNESMSAVLPALNDYPTTDGRPMAETDLHRDLMVDLIQTLQAYYAAEERVYVSGNLLVFYAEGDRRRHVSPDVFVVKGVPKGPRNNYLIWQEGRGPDLVVELTSASTRDEDVRDKMALYRDVIRVPEYFLFDPRSEYLSPPFQGYRLQGGEYMPIEPVDGRLPSEVLGLHLERDGRALRLYDPAKGRRLPTPAEEIAASKSQARREWAARRAAEAEADRESARSAAEAERAEREAARAEHEAARAGQEATARRVAEEEVARLRREIEALRRQPPTPPPAADGP
jgi:Uma2 family endonuclease